ncbi:YeiH family protein [Orenia marismortui]|uniref:Putative integral membrane protein (TIGR00698 family) n=1 Tax=Orenia marismortui TaxID=46469 RepID=A0A4R8GVB4_9FIRM|nr:putative sulfate exporter family transporter [Orenia marismortui]TDX48908.1 putative integral membrane protein (TIGR00698 family) [Orenia marismortui]
MSVVELAKSYKLNLITSRLIKKIPGIILLFVVGYISKIIAGYIPHMEYVLIAILLGMLISNTIKLPQIFVAGIESYELWLKLGIVLLGARLVLQNILEIGTIGLILVVLEIIVSIVTVKFLAKKFGLSDKLGSLLGIGIGICGVSAIIGASGAIDADEEEASLAIATILIFGAIMVFLYPLLGQIMDLSDQAFGFWSGLAIDNTAESLATGFAFSEAAGQVATITKLSRNALMGIIILFFALYYAKQGVTEEVENKAKFIWDRFPKFLLGFLLMSLLSTLGFFSKENIANIKHLYKWAFMLSFVGVGFRTEISKMKESGLKPFFVGLGAEVVVSIVTLITILLIY